MQKFTKHHPDNNFAKYKMKFCRNVRKIHRQYSNKFNLINDLR
ncbi:hypothetical protein GJA_449 [Janthinobacterium agaricidamnosum NBRC 102515 = DSM 9628]|uniref:Uncharacterized protein n=1 Tax=Janthinobacterium agaricidamnosum NBRC 102515 = DSM 9628 TaxID=1349767 RepID=W0UX57_9BURK|nr:hypothetical protein GJA_449 [Janthinobacterium agaricidamnosum NBRC 102515 = DSM 9628]